MKKSKFKVGDTVILNDSLSSWSGEIATVVKIDNFEAVSGPDVWVQGNFNPTPLAMNENWIDCLTKLHKALL
jgi:hypothetical protein